MTQQQADSRPQLVRRVDQLGSNAKRVYIIWIINQWARMVIQREQDSASRPIRFQQLECLIDLICLEQNGIERIAQSCGDSHFQFSGHVQRGAQSTARSPEAELARRIQ